jgi:hypothetical protein
MKFKPPILFSLALWMLFAAPSAIAQAETSEPPDPLFRDNAIINVTISAPWRTITRERPTEDYLPGTFSYKEPDGVPVKFDVEVRTRGHFRHDECRFPPLRLNFKKSQTDDTLFDKQDKLKLVVPCRDPKRYEQSVLKEYLAYLILNELTELSFRVRLLHVLFVDSERQSDELVRHAFLIEHKNRLAERFDMKDLELERTEVSSIQPDQLNLSSVFEFMIGNTDFSPIAGASYNECCHNYVLFSNKVDPIVAVPYDFDQSGFVDAPYAEPNPQFKIHSVKQRVYRGRCANNEYLPTSLQKFNERHDRIYAVMNGQSGLTPRTRKELIRYIDDFYKLINDPRDLERKIYDKCI